jgi:hypothetical protein
MLRALWSNIECNKKVDFCRKECSKAKNISYCQQRCDELQKNCDILNKFLSFDIKEEQFQKGNNVQTTKSRGVYYVWIILPVMIFLTGMICVVLLIKK